LSFTLRKKITNTSAVGHPVLEFWYAPSVAAITSGVLTATFTSNPDAACIVAIGVNGCNNINSPFDTNSSLPASTIVTGASVTLSTNQADDLLLCFTGTSSASGPNTPSGFTGIVYENGNGSSYYYRLGTNKKSVSATQSSLNVANGGGVVDVMLVDAFTADATASTAALAQQFGKITQAVSAKHEFKATVSQTFGKASQSVSAKVKGHITVAQTFAVISQHATDIIRSRASVSQSFVHLTQYANASRHYTAAISQTLPRLSQSVNATSRGNFESGIGFGYWLGPAFNMIGMKNK
jgi:hypothetical protein